MTGVGVRLFSHQTGENRNVILNDLGTAATHIAFNYNNPVNPVELETEFRNLLNNLQNLKRQVYRTFHPIDDSQKFMEVRLGDIEKEKGENGIYSVKHKGKKIQFVEAEICTSIWSEVNECTSCTAEINLWKVAMNPKTGKMAKKFSCESCGCEFQRKDFAKPLKFEQSYLIYEYMCPYTNKKKRFEREVALFDTDVFSEVERKKLTKWYPDQNISPKREMMTMGPAKLGVKKVSDFYTKRNLIVCSNIWDEIEKVKSARVKAALKFAATNTFWHATRMRRFNVKGGMRPLTGTLYIPQISAECNVFGVLENKMNELVKFYSSNFIAGDLVSGKVQTAHLNQSATNLTTIRANSVDYIFTDPPFGGNIFYSDCNVIWEGWLNKLTDDACEILFNRSRKPEDGGKTRDDYHSLMNAAFAEMYRVLKPGKWASVVFNNSDNDVLDGFINSARQAGFDIREVTFFDKEQKSVKGYMGQKGVQNVTDLPLIKRTLD